MLAGHTDSAQSVAFTPDGNTLTTSSDDGTVRLWDTDAFNDLATLTDHACTVAGRSLTEQAMAPDVRDGVAYHRICPSSESMINSRVQRVTSSRLPASALGSWFPGRAGSTHAMSACRS